jgi:hypothetical protein
MTTDADSGRWVPTFATDVAAGDKIRIDGKTEHFVIGREYPPSFRAAFRIEYSTGTEGIRKLDLIEIWDEDGSVSQRVQDLSAAAIR